MFNAPTLPVLDILTGPETDVEWLVTDFIPRGSLIALAGEAGAGKSFLVYTLSIALATGTDVLGFSMGEPKRVLYFDQENSLPDVSQYLRWAWNGLGRPNADLVASNLFVAHFQLGTATWANRASVYVDAVRPDLIVIDTTTPACSVRDENDNAEASQVITHLRQLQAMFRPTPAIIALKHSRTRPDDGGKTLRGAKTWEGAVDAVVHFTKLPGRPPKGEGLKPTKLEPHKTRAFGLRDEIKILPAWVGDGETRGIVLERRTALTVEPANDAEKPAKRPRRRYKPRKP